jgi:hypothetical protein
VEVEEDRHHLKEVEVEEEAVEHQAEEDSLVEEEEDSLVEEEEDHQEGSPLHKPLHQLHLKMDTVDRLEGKNHKSLTGHPARVKHLCKSSIYGQTSTKITNS